MAKAALAERLRAHKLAEQTHASHAAQLQSSLLEVTAALQHQVRRPMATKEAQSSRFPRKRLRILWPEFDWVCLINDQCDDVGSELGSVLE